MKKANKILISALSVAAASFCFFAAFRTVEFKNITAAEELSVSEAELLNQNLHKNYKERYENLQKLPYKINQPKLDVLAESAILIDVSNGCVLYEKNADEIIPPASMTKLFSMYVVDEEVSKGNLSYSDEIYLPEECWACNMPPHSSLMFLGKGQKVTLEELLLGLSICSGNDAAYALAYTVCGSMEDFVARMNEVASNEGLINTHFVESSGYSELNTTTAREMASFCRTYLQKHPESLARFHGVASFSYPKKQNLAEGDVLASQDFSQGIPEHITMTITQKNTNPLLGLLEGCDGLKTGYIDESGYNLALTAKRNYTRYLSVTMKGPGTTAQEGQNGRIHDGKELMEWAFTSFADYFEMPEIQPYFEKVYKAAEKGCNLVPAFTENTISVPFVNGNSVQDNLYDVKLVVEKPEFLEGEIEMGKQYGEIKILLGNLVLDTIPLVADRNIKKGNIFIDLADAIGEKL